MTRLSSRIALIALAGVMAVPPAFAAPNNNNNNSPPATTGSPIDCSLPINANLKYCMDLLKNKGPMGGNPNANGPTGQGGPMGQGGAMGNKGGFNPPGPPPNYKGPKPNTFHWNQQDRNYFHQRFNFGGFGSFSFFLSPNFSITIGSALPNTYHSHLKRVPYSVYHIYPWFRGYYFFIDRRGDFVIVNPRTFKIVAVL